MRWVTVTAVRLGNSSKRGKNGSERGKASKKGIGSKRVIASGKAR